MLLLLELLQKLVMRRKRHSHRIFSSRSKLAQFSFGPNEMGLFFPSSLVHDMDSGGDCPLSKVPSSPFDEETFFFFSIIFFGCLISIFPLPGRMWQEGVCLPIHIIYPGRVSDFVCLSDPFPNLIIGPSRHLLLDMEGSKQAHSLFVCSVHFERLLNGKEKVDFPFLPSIVCWYIFHAFSTFSARRSRPNLKCKI